MRPEDLFEILADIDEKMVSEARENFFDYKNNESEKEYTEEPVIVCAPRKKFPWKTASAACIALICAAGIGLFALFVNGSRETVSGGGIAETDVNAVDPPLTAPKTEDNVAKPALNISQRLDTEKKYDLDETPDGWDKTFDFDMPEFSGVKFFWSSDKVEAAKNGETETLYEGMPVWNVYLCDLNGDGKREICSTISFGSGIVDTRILVFDYENTALYVLEDRGNFDYSIYFDSNNPDSEQDNNALFYTRANYNETVGIDITENKHKLTLDIMKKLMPETLNDGGMNSQAAEAAEAPSDNSEDTAKNVYAEYESFGLVYKEGKLYFENMPVRCFVDYYPVGKDGNMAGKDYFDAEGVIDVQAVRDFENNRVNDDGSFDPSGRLTGVKSYPTNDSPVPYMIDMITGGGLDFTIEAAEEGNNLPGEIRMERLKDAEEYEPFGVTYDPEEDQWYFRGEKVRYFRDILTSNGEPLTSGNFSGSMRTLSGKGTVDIYTVRDFNCKDTDGKGKLIDIKAFEEGEIDLDAEMVRE